MAYSARTLEEVKENGVCLKIDTSPDFSNSAGIII